MATSPKVVPEQESEDSKRKRLRSPAYPFINLETAIKRARTFYEKDGRGASPLTVAAKHWGYEAKSSGSTQTAAALMSFGLMVDEGTGDKRKVKLTANALKILLDNRADSTEKAALLKQIALTPKIHQQVWSKWGTAENVSDENIQHVLVFDWVPPFNENTVAGFIREYSDTIAFAKLSESDSLAPEDGKGENADESSYVPQVGDYVQWESQGQIHFPEPVKILSLSSDRTHAFVAETTTGLPVKQLTREKAPLKITVPPPQHRASQLSQTTVKEDVYSIAEGRVVVQWPAALSAESIEIIKAQLKILERKITNCLVVEDKQGQPE
jgi:hypothetical protein